MPERIPRRQTVALLAVQPGAGAPVPAAGAFAPPLDVSETAHVFEVRVEIAGMSPEAVEVLVAEDNSTVTISGARAAALTAGRSRYLNLEIQYGPFSRRVRLPAQVDREAATARYADGLLVVTLPKLPGARKRRVPITGEVE